MAEIAKANAKPKGRVNPNNPKERAGNRRPKERVNSDSLNNRAGNGCPETRSTKVPTKNGYSFSVVTVNEDVSSGDDFSLASGDKARTTSLTMRQQEQPSGHARLEQQLGEEDCAGVVCWQKSPGILGYAGGAAGFLPGGATSAGGSALARRLMGGSQCHPASMALSDWTDRSPTGAKRPEGPKTTSPTRRTTMRTSTRTKTTTGIMRPATPSLLPSLQRNGLDDNAMYNDMLQVALRLDRCRRA